MLSLNCWSCRARLDLGPHNPRCRELLPAVTPDALERIIAAVRKG